MAHARLTTIVVAATLALASTARAQEAADAHGPFYNLGRTAQSVLMISDLPPSTPNGSAEFLEWHFLPQVQTASDMQYDTYVSRRRVDCSARMIEGLRGELYLAYAFVSPVPGSPAQPVAAGSFAETALTLVCTPAARASKRRHTDWRTARLDADLTFMDEMDAALAQP